MGLTQERAAEYIGTTRRTLCAYETGSCKVPEDIVPIMARVYKEPGLCEDYCQSECPIGQTRGFLNLNEDVNRSMLTVNMFDPELLNKAMRSFYKIFSDGVVHTYERKAYEDGITVFRTRANDLRQLCISAAKIAARSPHEEAKV